MTQNWDVIIVGGGLAGYVAANYLGKNNLSVLLLDKGKTTGGRAKTNKINQQYFNIGPHALYKKGKAHSILEELDITLHGKSPKLDGILLENKTEFAAPFSPLGLFSTNLLTWKERIEWGTVLWKLMNTNPDKLANLTFHQWVKEVTNSKKIESLLYTLGRLATYCHAPEVMSAKVTVSHLKNAIGGVRYIDGGWQTIIDQLHNQAILSGVQVQPSTLVKQIESGERKPFKLVLSNDEEIVGKYVIYTGGPREWNEMLLDEGLLEHNGFLDEILPIRGATLDVALTKLPNPKHLFAMGITDPLYYSVHSTYAQLSDDPTSTVLHVLKYHHPDDHVDGSSEKIKLEQFLSAIQPGWQQYVITQRFLPNITVNQRLPQVGDESKLQRFKTQIAGLYFAGDWASPNYVLAEGAVSSGKQAAEDIIIKQKERR
ncbi:NAD(P)/FAD-dependent oxidoreductase [Radiobacillus kanasensis]|uniref:phytoene desaturase family protein n=1 Tax=Radiobacillus kanasensis TaxID=2844358 RepID=UPI001E55E4B6|nr:NAD(P)/FAD-dependent oxidoreductase [Radiobacillus kanasensis]UFT99339.1 NAD(P)/FAD-dependent oxidoreductase [Radiobacillus kanasensis]